jgi:lysyl-tRNA synthetase class II
MPGKLFALERGIGIGHLRMMLLGQESICYVILFPRLKPK